MQGLVCAERDDNGDLWIEIIATNERSLKLEHLATARCSARDAGTERRRRNKRAQSLSQKAFYRKAANFLAQSPTLDPATPRILNRMKTPTPRFDDPVSIFPPRDLPKNPSVSSDSVRSSLSTMYFDFTTGRDRAGVRCLMLVAKSDFPLHRDFLGLKVLTMVVQKLTAGDFSPNFSHLIFAANLIALDKFGAKNKPIVIGVFMRSLNTKVFMPTLITEAKEHFPPLQVGCGVMSGLDFIVHDTRDAFFKLARETT